MNDERPQDTATAPDSEFILTVEDACLRYARAGHPRTVCSIKRYCANGCLDCRRIETPAGDKYLITPASIAAHVALIEELQLKTIGRDAQGLVEPTEASGKSQEPRQQDATAGPDLSRLVGSDVWYMERLQDENVFLHDQLTIKDELIQRLTERVREAHHLNAGLQSMLTPVPGQHADPHNDVIGY